ncbi:MAG TPA: hypothetical protein VMD28_00845 [Acidimicrobiales bacterium]|nr:hypothetical protein [Acidimicrobiales bacterium]
MRRRAADRRAGSTDEERNRVAMATSATGGGVFWPVTVSTGPRNSDAGDAQSASAKPTKSA